MAMSIVKLHRVSIPCPLCGDWMPESPVGYVCPTCYHILVAREVKFYWPCNDFRGHKHKHKYKFTAKVCGKLQRIWSFISHIFRDVLDVWYERKNLRKRKM